MPPAPSASLPNLVFLVISTLDYHICHVIALTYYTTLLSPSIRYDTVGLAYNVTFAVFSHRASSRKLPLNVF